ncbi:hypothetical protein AGMMS50218_17240 [Actinomycetota bacterium]|nr:hypothetical protein AGMMS50218_17240 [Actinomycetota bacterium]
MDFVASSARWLVSLDHAAVAPGFAERLAATAGQSAEPRSLAAPYYLTDLGVRRFDDPRLFLAGHLEILGHEHASATADDALLLRTTPVEALGHVLDTFILVTGDYPTAHTVVSERLEAILAGGTTGLLVQVGVLLGALGDERARLALTRAADIAHHPTDRFMASHRLAAAEIKRFNRPTAGLHLLDEIDREIDAARNADTISGGDRETLLSVTANLRALGLSRLGRPVDVYAEIVRSRGMHTLDDLREVVLGEAARYGSQERINLAQVLADGGDLAASVATLEENVEYCNAVNPDYLGEALTALAYGQFRAERWADAASTATAATVRVAFEASPTRLRAAREIRLAAHARAGEEDQAREVLHACEQDPLGLTLSRPQVKDGVPA